jgi:hypothetical protein
MSDRLSQEDVKALEKFAAFIRGMEGGQAQKEIVWPHGDGGLLTYPGARPAMWNLTPRVGTFINKLPLYPSRNEKEIYEFITGVTAQTGTNPANYCATPMKGGKMKAGQIIAQYGQFFKGTDEINVMQAGRFKNRSDVRRRLLNTGYDEITNNPFIPMPINAGPESLNTIVGKTFLEFGQGVLLDFAYVLWRGNITKDNTQTYPGFIKEFNGFDQWIKTGYTDVVSGSVTPSLDSQVVNYNATLGSQFVLKLSNMIRTLIVEAELKNTPNVIWELVMHPRAMFPIFDIWACNYMTARCMPTESNGQILDQTGINRLRDEMIRGRYLLIDGERFTVSFDAGIEATLDATGEWTSDVYIVPMDDGRGNALSYFEYMPRDAANNDELAEIMQLAPGEWRVMNGGLYLAGFKKREAFCLEWQFGSEVRLIVERPDLAGRIDNVKFTSDTPFNDPYPGATYHKNGGTTFRAS